MKRKTLVVVALFLLLAAIPTGLVLAAPALDSVVEAGETINNDITLFGEDLEVAEGATVNGDVVVFNGDVRIAGQVNGDVVLFNGDLEVASSASISGVCGLVNGELDDETESGLNCSSFDGASDMAAAVASISEREGWPDLSDVRVDGVRGRSVFGEIAGTFLNTLVMGALAFVAASLLPEHLRQVQTAVQQKPVASGAVGLLTAVAVPSLLVLLTIISAVLLLVCIGILGFGVVIAMAIALGAAMLFGWISVGNLAGQWLAERFNLAQRTLPVTAAIGTMALTLSVGLVDAVIPFLGIVGAIVSMLGLGAVALTQFGRRPYPYLATAEPNIVIHENPAKVSAVLDTMPEDPSELK